MAVNVDFQVIPTKDPNVLIVLDTSDWDTILGEAATIEFILPGSEDIVILDFIKGEYNTFDSNSFVTSTVEDETFTSVYGLPVNLTKTNLVVDSAVVTNIAGDVIYTITDDYTIDYELGTITVVDGGIMATLTAYKISYTYVKDIEALSDGIYSITVKALTPNYFKAKNYLRVEAIKLALDKVLIGLDIYHNNIDRETFNKITDIDLLLRSAEAHAAFDNAISAGTEYDKAFEKVTLMLGCEDCI